MKSILSNFSSDIKSPPGDYYSFGSSTASPHSTSLMTGLSGSSGVFGTSGPIGVSGWSGSVSIDDCLKNVVKRLEIKYKYKYEFINNEIKFTFKSINFLSYKKNFSFLIIYDLPYRSNKELEEVLTLNIKKHIREINLNKILK